MRLTSIVLLGITLIMSTVVHAQRHKLGGGVLDRSKKNTMRGWYLGPGLSYTYPYLKEKAEVGGSDTLFKDVLKPKGKLGAYFEAGYFKYMSKRFLIFDYWDAGLSYKWLRSGETSERQMVLNGSETSLGSGEAKHSAHNLVANFNLSHTYDMGGGNFWVNTFGLNFDYSISQSQKTEGAFSGGNVTPLGKDSYYFQLHYKMGYGFEWNDRLMIVPMLETPILNILPFQSGKSTMNNLFTRNRPLLLSVRFMFINNKAAKKCPPVNDIPDAEKLLKKEKK